MVGPEAIDIKESSQLEQFSILQFQNYTKSIVSFSQIHKQELRRDFEIEKLGLKINHSLKHVKLLGNDIGSTPVRGDGSAAGATGACAPAEI